MKRIRKGKDISTMYAKQKNIVCGRKGYVLSGEKCRNISPSEYGMFLQSLKKN